MYMHLRSSLCIQYKCPTPQGVKANLQGQAEQFCVHAMLLGKAHTLMAFTSHTKIVHCLRHLPSASLLFTLDTLPATLLVVA